MDERPTLVDYWLALYRRKLTIVLVVVSACGFAWYLSVNFPPLYEARTTFYVPANASPTTFVGSQFTDQLAQQPLMPMPEEKASAATLGILRSRRIMEALHADFPERRLDQLRKNVDVTIGSEFLVEIYVRDRDPKLAAAVANRLPVLYEEFHRRILGERIRRVVDTLSKQRQDINRRLVGFSRRLRQVQERTGVLSPDLSAERTSGLISDLRVELQTTETRLAAAQESLNALAQQLRRERNLYRQGELVLSSPRLEKLQGRLIDIRAELATIRQDPYNPGLPTRQAELEAQMQQTRVAVENEIERLVNSQSKLAGSVHEKLRQDLVDRTVDLSSLEASRAAIATSLVRLEEDLLTLPATTRNIEDLRSSIDRLRTLYENVNSHLLEARLQARNLPRSMVLVESAPVPERPVFPLPVLNTIVAGLVGLVLGCYYALLLDYLGRLRRQRLTRQMDRSPLDEASLPALEGLIAQWAHPPQELADDGGRSEEHTVNGQLWRISEQRTPDGHVVSRWQLLAPNGGPDAPEALPEEDYVVYAPDGRIVEMSAGYPALYPAMQDLIRVGARLEDLLHAAVRRGLVAEAETSLDDWVRQTARRRLHPERSD